MKLKIIKNIKIILSMFMLILFMGVNKVNAYNFTENDYYIILDCQTVGTIKVYIPQDKVEFLQIKEDVPTVVNVSSGTIYGYFIHDYNEYRITFNTFDDNTYRNQSTNMGTQNQELIIRQIIETNIPQLKADKSIEDIINIKYQEVIIIIMLCILFLGVVSWLRH